MFKIVCVFFPFMNCHHYMIHYHWLVVSMRMNFFELLPFQNIHYTFLFTLSHTNFSMVRVKELVSGSHGIL